MSDAAITDGGRVKAALIGFVCGYLTACVIVAVALWRYA